MSDMLRRIVTSQKKEDNPFFQEADGKIIERTPDRGEVFTGFYQADDGTYYSEQDWIAYRRQLELDRIAEEEWQEEQNLKEAARKEREKKKAAYIAAQQQTKKKPRGLLTYSIIGIVCIVIIGSLIYFFVNPSSSGAKASENEIVRNQEIETPTIIEEAIYGNGKITGSDVRMREEPNLQAKIVTHFAEEGERIKILVSKSDTLNWSKVERKDGTIGWVYGEFVSLD